MDHRKQLTVSMEVARSFVYRRTSPEMGGIMRSQGPSMHTEGMKTRYVQVEEAERTNGFEGTINLEVSQGVVRQIYNRGEKFPSGRRRDRGHCDYRNGWYCNGS